MKNPGRQFKDAIYEQFSRIGKAISLAENRLAEVDLIKRRFLDGREGMEPVNRDDLLTRVVEGGVTVLDVRPTDEYMAGHIPGALSVPLDRLKEILANLPADQEIVAYCRGPYCVLSVQAVEVLRANGFNAIRLEEGVQDWRAMGLPLEIGV
jgi:rhodanese-related sulfurtransferase